MKWPWHDQDMSMIGSCHYRDMIYHGTTMIYSCYDYTIIMAWPWYNSYEHDLAIPLTWLFLGVINCDKFMTFTLGATQPWDNQELAKKYSWMITYDHLIMVMTQSWHNQELTILWSYNDHIMTMGQEGYDNGVIVIAGSFVISLSCCCHILHVLFTS